ncbi:MAG: hypothetical protein H7Y18_11635 [Clostridiaceae bacterium]|nr:hypothetical protein [Clostridiaceae bacterium]
MEKIGDILEKVFEDYEKKFINKDNNEDTDIQKELKGIVDINEDIKINSNTMDGFARNKRSTQNEIFLCLSELLLNYGEFKRIPKYYKTINGKAQDYVYFEDSKEELKGFKIIEKNVYRKPSFISEELYFIESGQFYKFSSEIKEKNGYKESFRDFKYLVEDPSNEWNFLNVLQNIRMILTIRLEHIKRKTEKEQRLNKFLDLWADELEDIINF